jgi:tape measure domain-containing protein
MAEQLTIKINGDVKDYKKSVKEVSSINEKLGEGLRIATEAAAVGFAGLTAAAGFAINEARKIEAVTTQFEVLTGSAGEAAKIVKDLQQFSAKTPFQFEGIAKASQQLLGFGFEADQVQGKLQQIGDVASAVGRPIEEVGFIFGQVAAAGKLTGERLLQFQERAIPIGPAIAKTMGIAETAVKDAVSKGQVDLATFEKAFASLSEKGGFAFEGMIKQSKTLGGVMSTVKDNVSIFAAEIGQEMLPVVKVMAENFLKFIQNLRESGEGVKTFNTVLRGTLKVAAYVKAAFLNLGGIIGTSLAAAMEAASAAIKFNFAEAKEHVKSGAQEIGNILKENNKGLNEDLLAIDDAFSEAARQKREKEKEDMIAHADEVREIKVQKRQEEQEALDEEEEEKKEREKEKLIEHQAALEEIEKKRIMNVNEAKRAVAVEDAKETAKENDLRMKEEQRYGKNIAKMKSFFRSKDAEGFGMLFDNLATLGQSGNKRLAEIAKQSATAKAIMNTAEGMTKALTYGPILGPILAGTVAAAGAVQVGVIQGVKFDKGGVFSGGIPGVDSIPALVKQKEIIAPTQNFEEVIGSVRAKREAEEIAGEGAGIGGGQMEVVVAYDSPEASQIVTVQQVEDTALGVSRDSFKETT